GDGDPLPAAVEVLASCALFAGSVDETSPIEAWLGALLEARTWEAAAHAPPSGAYPKILRELNKRSVGFGDAKLLDVVREALNSAKGNARGYVLDAARVLPALEAFRAAGARFVAQMPPKLRGDWQAAEQLRKGLRDNLRALLDDEARALKAWL